MLVSLLLIFPEPGSSFQPRRFPLPDALRTQSRLQRDLHLHTCSSPGLGCFSALLCHDRALVTLRSSRSLHLAKPPQESTEGCVLKVAPETRGPACGITMSSCLRAYGLTVACAPTSLCTRVCSQVCPCGPACVCVCGGLSLAVRSRWGERLVRC